MMHDKSVVVVLICLSIVLCFVSYCSCKEQSGKDRRSPNDTIDPSGLCALDSCSCTNFLPHSTTTSLQWIKINCNFGKDEEVEIIPGSLPIRTREIVLTGGRSITLTQQCFTRLIDPAILILRGFNNALIAKHAFLNLTANHPVVHITDCELLTIETGAFKNTGGPPSVNITQCGHVVLNGEIFSRLNLMTITDVLRLDLHEGAFMLESRLRGRHGHFTKILLKNIKAENFPKKTFGSSVDEIRLQDVIVRDVQGDAFSATSYNTVIAINSSFYKIYKEAFSQKTHINNKLELYNCTIASLATDAVLSGTSNLTIKYNKLKEVATGAISMSVARVCIEDNEIEVIHTRGFEFGAWSQITIERNVFVKLETDPIVCLIDDMNNYVNSFSFTFVNNGIFKLTQGSLKFISDIQAALPKITYENTYFDQVCMCEIESWLRSVFDRNSSFLQEVIDNSYCTVKNPILARCYNLFQESMLIRNFTTETCTNETNIKCLPSVTKNTAVTNDVLNSKFLNRKNQIREAEEAEMLNKKIVRIILIVASVGVVMIVLFVIIRRSGYCIPIANASVSSNNCCVRIFDRICNVHYGLDTARSISRLSIHEYNESHRLNETRVLNVENGGVEEEQLIEVEVPTIDKATQTLPEELTKELLESLREKLDDPDNYSEAREMIEHLYDLIKVEESCNSNNNIPGGSGGKDYMDEEDNLYDVIQVPVRRKGKNNKIMVNVGTRVPSLEKLAQFSPYMRSTALCHEYFEPRDRALHLYAELPGDRNSDLPQMPDLVGERTSRPLSFLRAIGEKIQPNPTVPGGSVRSIDSATRMANRPLPEKPKDPGEGTSFQRH